MVAVKFLSIPNGVPSRRSRPNWFAARIRIAWPFRKRVFRFVRPIRLGRLVIMNRARWIYRTPGRIRKGLAVRQRPGFPGMLKNLIRVSSPALSIFAWVGRAPAFVRVFWFVMLSLNRGGNPVRRCWSRNDRGPVDQVRLRRGDAGCG